MMRMNLLIDVGNDRHIANKFDYRRIKRRLIDILHE